MSYKTPLTHAEKVNNFLKRNNFEHITENTKQELTLLFDYLKQSNMRVYDWKQTILGFILYELDDLVNRLVKIKNTKHMTLDCFILRYGEYHGKEKYKEFISKTRNLKTDSDSQRRRAILANKKKADLGDCNPRTKQYWISRHGCSEEEAISKVSAVQKTFNKELCVQKYGEKDGLKIWTDRQIRWRKSLSKSLKNGYSGVSKQLFDELRVNFPDILYGENEQAVSVKEKVYWVDCLLPSSNSIVEFYGDYWHANPMIFEQHKIFKRGAHEITTKMINDADSVRIKDLEDKNYQVLIIWEQDFKRNKTEVIDQCRLFLVSSTRC